MEENTLETSATWRDEILPTSEKKARKLLLRKNGWNVDVPITSHYRQGPKRGKKRGPKKKHLTGNSYYAAKAAKGPKNFYYQDMGKKGGRPRIYNRIEP